MSTKKVEKSQFEEVVGRLMTALVVENEYNVAESLGFKKDTFSARKKRGALPVDKIRLLCADRGINFNWVMTGAGDLTEGLPSREGPISRDDAILEFVLSMEKTPELRLLLNDLKNKTPDEVLDYIRGGRKALREKE